MIPRSAAVILVANNFPPVRGGSAAVYDQIARHAGGRVIVVAPKTNYVNGLKLIGWREHDRHAGARIVRVDLLRTELDASRKGWLGALRFTVRDLMIRLRLVWTVLRLVISERASTLCVGELLASGWLLELFRLMPGLRRVVYVHGEEITTTDPYDPDHRRARRVLQAAHGIVVVSRFTLAAVASLLGGPQVGKIALVENGVDTKRFTAGPKPPDLEARYGLADCFVFVSVCRLLEKKGIDHAIAAFALSVASDPACRFLIVGGGPFDAALRAAAVAHGVAGQVVFAGEVPAEDLAAHYRLGDVFVMPNRCLANGDTEGFGLVFLEANCSGIPVIAGRDGGSTDAVAHGVNGLVVDGAAVPEIAAAMTALRQDEALRMRLRAGGLRVVAESGWRTRADLFLRFSAGAPAAIPDAAARTVLGA